MPQPSTPSQSIIGPTVADLMLVMDMHDAADRRDLARNMLEDIQSVPGIPGPQKEAALTVVFLLAQVALGDVALSEMNITPANIEDVLIQVHKVSVMQRHAERQLSLLASTIEPATVATLLILARDHIAAMAPASPTVH